MSIKTKIARIIFIEYHDGRPHSVVTEYACDKHDGTKYQRHTFYDVDWCKQHKTLYWHESGSGPAAPLSTYDGSTFWAAPHITFHEWDKATDSYLAVVTPKGKRLSRSKGRKKLERAIRGGEWPDYVEGIEESECIYCPMCDDHLPSEGTNDPCEHIWWCDDLCDWSLPGERCPWDCKECLEYEREVNDIPQWRKVAQGYGAAASRLGSIVRRIMERHAWTAASLSREHWGGCSVATEVIAAAMRGDVHDELERHELEAIVRRRLPLADEERAELIEAFRNHGYRSESS